MEFPLGNHIVGDEELGIGHVKFEMSGKHPSGNFKWIN